MVGTFVVVDIYTSYPPVSLAEFQPMRGKVGIPVEIDEAEHEVLEQESYAKSRYLEEIFQKCAQMGFESRSEKAPLPQFTAVQRRFIKRNPSIASLLHRYIQAGAKLYLQLSREKRLAR